jgi:TRAP transporter 4TM/12TM fusion protein
MKLGLIDNSEFMKNVIEKLTYAVALTAVAYHFMAVWIIPFRATRHYAVHYGFITFLAVLTAAMWALTQRRRYPQLKLVSLGVILMGSLVSSLYYFIQDERLEMAIPWITTLDAVIGLVVLVVILGLNYLIWGFTITFICFVCIVYTFYGHLIPGFLWHPEIPPFVSITYLAGMGTVQGVFLFIPLSADTIFLLLIFGGLLQGTRCVEMFIELGKAAGNLVRGGIAYSAVVSSAMVAMVTGEAISNVVLSGSMTIGAMKSRGFRAEQAGAIEVVASSGSQITPPIMSVAAFLMATILNVAFFDIMHRAIIPALLYYIGLTVGLTLMIRGTPEISYRREPVNLTLIFGILPSFLAALGVLVYVLSLRYSAGYAAFWGVCTLVVLSVLRPKVARPTVASVFDGLKRGALVAGQLGVVLIGIGIIIQTFMSTGVGVIMGQVISMASGGQLWIALVVGAAVAISLGTALPTPAAYALMTVVVVPTLIDLGAAPMAAHFFALYWAAFSPMSPPVAVAVMAAIRISEGSFMATSLNAIKLCIPVFFLPFAYVLAPNILGIPSWNLGTVEVAFAILIASLASAGAFFGFLPGRLSMSTRLTLALVPISLFAYLTTESSWYIIIGLLILGIIVVKSTRTMRATDVDF